MRRARLPFLLFLLLASGFAVWAYRSYDPDAGPPLDEDEVLPEGRGFAPRPERSGTNLPARLGRWIHDRLDPLVGVPAPQPRPADVVRLRPLRAATGPPGSLRIRVRHPDGAAGTSAYVTVHAPLGSDVPVPKVTGERGEALFEDLPSGPGYVVGASLARDGGRSDGAARAGTLVEPGVVREVDLTLSSGTVTGQVVDLETGEPVPHAAVEARPALDATGGVEMTALRLSLGPSTKPALLRTTVADSEGRFRVGPLLAGEPVLLWARTEDGRVGVAAAERLDRPSNDVRIRVAVPRTASATVVDEDGQGVAGARVWIPNSDAEARTDAAGRFSLVADEGYAVVIERDDVLRSVTLRLYDGAYLVFPRRTALEVRVLSPADDGLPDAFLYVFGVAAEGDQQYRVRARTDGAGRARVPVSPGRVQSIRVRADERSVTFDAQEGETSSVSDAGAAGLVAPMRPGEVRGVTLTLPRELVIRGRAVFADGRPAARTHIAVRGARAGLDPAAVAREDGRFRLLVPWDGHEVGDDLVLGAEIPGVARGEREVPSAPAGTEAREVDLGDVMLETGGILRGRVVDADGAPVADARVADGRFGAGARTDEQGVYRLPVLPGAVHSLVVTSAHTREREVHIEGRIAAGQVRDAEPVVLRRPLTLRVRVVDLGDDPVAGVAVRVTPSPRGDGGAPPRTDAEGRVEVADFGAGPAPAAGEASILLRFWNGIRSDGRVLLTLPDGTDVEREFDAPEDAPDPFEVVVRVPDTFVVEGLVRDESGAGVEAATVRAARDRGTRGVRPAPDLARVPHAALETTTDAAGRFRLVLAGVGGERWVLAAEGTAGRVGKTEVATTGRTRVEIRLEAAARAAAGDAQGK